MAPNVYPHRADIFAAVALKDEATFGAGLVAADFTAGRRVNVGTTLPSVDPDRQDVFGCSNEIPSQSEDFAWNESFTIDAPAAPTLAAWSGGYCLGGGAGLTVAGSGDPYTYTIKRLQAPSYQPDSLAMVIYYKGYSPSYYLSKGGIMNTWRVSGSNDRDKTIRLNSQILFDGTYGVLSSFAEPACTKELPYRFTGATFHFGLVGGSDFLDNGGVTAPRFRSFEYAVNMNADDDPERSGLYVAFRERGPLEVTAKLTVLGAPGDAIWSAFLANSPVYFNTAMVHPSGADRDWTINMPLAYFTGCKATWIGRVNHHAWEVTLKGYLDETSSGTTAATPFNMTIESGIASLRT